MHDKIPSCDLIAVTFHLMTCYSLRPCPRLAAKIAEHLELLLQTHGESFGPWQGTLGKMRDHWFLRAGLGGGSELSKRRFIN
jgi:hypothetical protein